MRLLTKELQNNHLKEHHSFYCIVLNDHEVWSFRFLKALKIPYQNQNIYQDCQFFELFDYDLDGYAQMIFIKA